MHGFPLDDPFGLGQIPVLKSNTFRLDFRSDLPDPFTSLMKTKIRQKNTFAKHKAKLACSFLYASYIIYFPKGLNSTIALKMIT